MLASNISKKVSLHHKRSDVVPYDCMVREFFAPSDGLFSAVKANTVRKIFDTNFGVVPPHEAKDRHPVKIKLTEDVVEDLRRAAVLKKLR